MANDAAMNRRDFVRAAAGAGLAAATPMPPGTDSTPIAAPAVWRSAVRPLVIADASGIDFKNGGPECAVERAYRLITEGKDVLDALIAGVNIPELDPEETGIGYGALPNADGVVQLDASCMHGPRRRAGGVAAIEGVRTPSLVAQAVMDQTDHHLLAGKGAQDFARKDAGMEALKRIRANTVESRLLNARGLPNFNIRFFVLDKKGQHAGVAMYGSGEKTFALCTDKGAEAPTLEPLLAGDPAD